MEREERKLEEERPVREAGGGEAEGFEEAEAALIEAAEHGDERDPRADAYEVAPESELAHGGAEADQEHSSERGDDDR